MGALHPQHVWGTPAHRPGHAAGHRGGRGRRAVPPGDGLSSRARTAAIRDRYDPASAPGFRTGRPGPADGLPELSAAGALLARPAAGHGFRGATVAKCAAVSSAEFKPDCVAEPDCVTEPEHVAEPERVLNATVPEPEFTGSDRLRGFAAISRHPRWRAATPGACRTSWGTGKNVPAAANEPPRPHEAGAGWPDIAAGDFSSSDAAQRCRPRASGTG
jgi:hypothetical protein